jgi:type II secretory pathway component GspD/PulD (secretin)
MDDVPLTDAIRNLARQAGLNYMLDPKVAFGQAGADGKPALQPSVSIRWENVSAEQALMALLNNYGLQLAEDAKSHIARVTVKDPAAPEPLITRIFQLKYSNPSNIMASVTTALQDKRSRIMPDSRTKQLVLLATERELDDIGKMIERLDAQTKQVLIEARMVETSMDPSSIKGVDWTGTLQSQHVTVGNNLQNTPVTAGDSMNRPLSTLWPKMMLDSSQGFNPATAFLDADGVSAVFSFLNTYAESKVLSCPRTVTLDNEPASISVTRASPIFNITGSTANNSGTMNTTYTNLGIILNVVPRIAANNYVNLRVQPEVSRIFDTVTRTLAGTVYQADEYDLRKMDTQVMIPSGHTLVLGGMIQDDVSRSSIKVPLLGDIPVLGFLFRSDNNSRQKSNLIIFITPTIVQDSDFTPTKTDYLKTKPPMEDSLEPDWGPWDSGKAKDWSKPAATNDVKAKTQDASLTASKASDQGFGPVPQ